MKGPLISIIMPVFNAERFLSEAIHSALQQTWPTKQLIIVDDGSTDSSLSIARKFESENVLVISVPNGGAARARNIGFQYSTGDFIQYLDADDLMKEDKMELQMKRLLAESDSQSTICAGQWLRFGKDLTDIFGGVGPGPQAEKDMSPVDWLLLRPYNLMTVHAWLTPRKLIEEAGPWNETMTLDDDGEFFIRVVSKASKVIFCPGVISFYRTSSEDSLSKFITSYRHPDGCNKFRSAYKSLLTYQGALKKFSHPDTQKAINLNLLLMAFNSYLICDEVYESCYRQLTVSVCNRLEIYKIKRGVFGLVNLLVGWKAAKRLHMLISVLKF